MGSSVSVANATDALDRDHDAENLLSPLRSDSWRLAGGPASVDPDLGVARTPGVAGGIRVFELVDYNGFPAGFTVTLQSLHGARRLGGEHLDVPDPSVEGPLGRLVLRPPLAVPRGGPQGAARPGVGEPNPRATVEAALDVVAEPDVAELDERVDHARALGADAEREGQRHAPVARRRAGRAAIVLPMNQRITRLTAAWL